MSQYARTEFLFLIVEYVCVKFEISQILSRFTLIVKKNDTNIR